MKLKPILQSILDNYAQQLGGDHGIAHWARVLENGLRLAEATVVNVEVVQLFRSELVVTGFFRFGVRCS